MLHPYKRTHPSTMLQSLSLRTKLSLSVGRHLDADEAVVLGAGLFAANLSTTFRLRKFGMTDGATFPLIFQVSGSPEFCRQRGATLCKRRGSTSLCTVHCTGLMYDDPSPAVCENTH